MVEVTGEYDDMAFARIIVDACEEHITYEDRCIAVRGILKRHRQAGVQQGLDMAATWLENEASQRLHSPDIEIGHTVSVLEDVAAAIRKLGGGDA